MIDMQNAYMVLESVHRGKQMTVATTTESKHDRFIRVAEARTNKILNLIRLLGNCSGRGVYDYTEEEVTKIFSAIEREMKAAKSKFISDKESAGKFTLQG